MIVLYTGTPGSGKSLHAAHDIRYALNKPGGAPQPVLANFDVNLNRVRNGEYFTYMPNDVITPKKVTDYCDEFWTTGLKRFEEDYILLVLDECQLIFNARSWHDKGTGRRDSRMDWLEFLSQHRKYGVKVILIAQSAKMIDNQFRMLTEYEINHRKASNVGLMGALLSLPFGNRLFVKNKYLFATNEHLGLRLSFGLKRDMRMYDSYTKLQQV